MFSGSPIVKPRVPYAHGRRRSRHAFIAEGDTWRASCAAPNLNVASHVHPVERERGRVMTPSYTIKNLRDVKDSAPDFGMAEVQEAHFAHGELDASDTGLSFHAVKPNQRQAFGHKHEN